MHRTILAAALAAGVSVGFAAAAAPEEISTGAVLGTDHDAIRAALVEKGYEVRKVESEDGALEAYAMKDGRRYEIYVDAASGAVTKVEGDD